MDTLDDTSVLIPDVFEGRALLVLAALGFTLAAGNTKGV